jgi:MSHA pilin protein MshA
MKGGKGSRQKGFTLIEIIVVMVILGILAVVAIPKFVDLTTQAKIAASQSALGAVRSTLSIKYAENAATGGAAYPAALVAADFANNKLPMNKLNGNDGIGTVAAAPGGTATSATNGFWYIVASGEAGAYSDGTEDTSTW